MANQDERSSTNNIQDGIDRETRAQLAEYEVIESDVLRTQARLRGILRDSHQSREGLRTLIRRLEARILAQEIQPAGLMKCTSRAANAKMWKLRVLKYHRKSAISTLNYLSGLERRAKHRLRQCLTFLRIIDRARRSLCTCPGQPIEKVFCYFREPRE